MYVSINLSRIFICKGLGFLYWRILSFRKYDFIASYDAVRNGYDVEVQKRQKQQKDMIQEQTIKMEGTFVLKGAVFILLGFLLNVPYVVIGLQATSRIVYVPAD